uniref:Uncharacterized protein n=1 Tax=Marseillevirus LCMAC103 TaxID=2506604 RepID=A0A481YU94_9VIRU|nr:MAG: hypothetical protein LCMAC103_00080 [Marseillevirus LCMAC103]
MEDLKKIEDELAGEHAVDAIKKIAEAGVYRCKLRRGVFVVEEAAGGEGGTIMSVAVDKEAAKQVLHLVCRNCRSVPCTCAVDALFKRCCHTETRWSDEGYSFRCHKEDGDIPYGRQCFDCAVWYCGLHTQIRHCGTCGLELEEV